MSFLEVWHAESLSRDPPLEVHLAPWLEGEFVGLIAHVPAKVSWPNSTWKRIGNILFICFPILLEKGLEL